MIDYFSASYDFIQKQGVRRGGHVRKETRGKGLILKARCEGGGLPNPYLFKNVAWVSGCLFVSNKRQND